MYAAVRSYIARIWWIFDVRYTRSPPLWAAIALAAAIAERLEAGALSPIGGK